MPKTQYTLLRFARRLSAGGALLCMPVDSYARPDPAVLANEFGAVPFVLWALFTETPKYAQQGYVTIGGGVFDAIDGIDLAGEMRIEFRPGNRLWKGTPFGGAALTTDGGAYVYGGLRMNAHFGSVTVSPSFAVTAYHRGDGKELGSKLVARSGFDFSWRLHNGNLLGVTFHHMSHGRVFGHSNPGTEMVSVTYSVPWDSMGR